MQSVKTGRGKDDLEHLLSKTSRTFALTIPLLPTPTRTDVMLAYLIFRIADTLEDAENLPPQARVDALMEFGAVLQSRDELAAARFAHTWSSLNPSTNEWYVKLLGHADTVVRETSHRDDRIAAIVFWHAHRSTLGMAKFAMKAVREKKLSLRSIDELKQYCYVVAGVVGEMLTEIFSARLSWNQTPQKLNQLARTFGEGLQLVNILKDCEADRRNGRLFLPHDVDRAEIFRLAREDLKGADGYVKMLREANAQPGYIAFANLPLQLAHRTLECIERDGPGSKVSRDELADVLAAVVLDSHRSNQPADASQNEARLREAGPRN